MKRPLLAFALLGAMQAVAGQSRAPEVQAVLAKPLERLATADFRAFGRLVRIDARGARTTYPFSLAAHAFPGVLRVLARFDAPIASLVDSPTSAPKPGKVHFLLEMRRQGYTSGQILIQIAYPGDKQPSVLPFARWKDGPAGPGFSFEDFLEPQFDWLEQSVVPNSPLGSRVCDLLTSIPAPSDKTHYTKIKTWLDHGMGYPVYVEKSLQENGTSKQFTYFGLHRTGGLWLASQIEEKTRGEAGSTLLIVERGTTKANLDLRDFSPEQITRF